MAKDKKQLSPQEQKVADAKREAAKQAKFVELAQKRASKAIHAIRNVGNLSNRGSYSYTSEQVSKLMTALAEEVKAVNGRFTAPAAAKAKPQFTF